MENSDHNQVLPVIDANDDRVMKSLAVKLPTGNDHHNDDIETDSESSSDSSDSEYACTICKMTFSGYIPLKQHEKGSKHKKAVSRKKKERKLLDKDSDELEVDEDQEYLIQEPFSVCKACDKQFSGSEPYHMHMKSKAHKKKVLEASILDQVRNNGELNVDKLRELYKSKKPTRETGDENLQEKADEDHNEIDSSEFECKNCDKIFSGLIPFTQHLMSKTHSKHAQRKKLMRKIVPDTSSNISDETEAINDISTLSVEDDILVCKVCSTSFSGPENAMLHMKSQKHKKSLEKYLKKLEKRKKKALSESGELNSESKNNEGQNENKQEDETFEEKGEPSANLPDEPQASETSDREQEADISESGEKTIENVIHEKYELYKRAIQSHKQEH